MYVQWTFKIDMTKSAVISLGFSAWLVQYLVYLKGLPIWAINLIVSALTATMTEVVSNTATANIVLPILKEMSLTLCYNPVYMGNVNNIKYTKR